MGVSTVMSYRGAQLFECVGLSADVVARYFTGTPSRVGGIGLEGIAADVRRRHEHALSGGELDPGGVYAYRLRGERHVWNPEVITVAAARRARRAPRELRGLRGRRRRGEPPRRRAARPVELVPAASRCRSREVEPSSEIVRRFASGAMSLGSISKEAHETLAIAINRLGGRSNSGEGGEDARRSQPDANGDSRRSAIKQVASARFGVTTAYLVDADVLQIKVSQGAKPGEGGQLPGHKVDVEIARLRHSTPGVGLISPPPHHDIYSIEDLAQLIHDLRCVNPTAEISVKLVALAGVGTVAAGRRQGRRRPHRDRRHGRRHRRLADLVDPARRRALGARPRRDPAGAGRQRAARPRAPAGRRRAAHGARRRDRRAARRRGVRVLDRSARRRRAAS